MLDSCIAVVLSSLRSELPDFRTTVAIDGSALPAYANGQRFRFNHGPEREKFSDPTLRGSPFGDLDPQGWRLLWVQNSRRR